MLEQLRPHVVARRMWEIDVAALAARGIQGVILDLDNTLAPWRSLALPEEALAWAASARAAGLRLSIVTNALTTARVQPVAERLEAPWVVRAGKPLARGFLAGMQRMGTTPATTAVVGDQMLTDILGGNRLGLYTILVEPMHPRESLLARIIHRPFERMIGRVPKAGG